MIDDILRLAGRDLSDGEVKKQTREPEVAPNNLKPGLTPNSCELLV